MQNERKERYIMNINLPWWFCPPSFPKFSKLVHNQGCSQVVLFGGAGMEAKIKTQCHFEGQCHMKELPVAITKNTLLHINSNYNLKLLSEYALMIEILFTIHWCSVTKKIGGVSAELLLSVTIPLLTIWFLLITILFPPASRSAPECFSQLLCYIITFSHSW